MNLLDLDGTGRRRTAFGRAVHRRLSMLRGNEGSTAESIVSVVLSVAIIGIIAAGALNSTGALGATTSNAERTQQLNIMTGDPLANVPLDTKWKAATTAAIAEEVNLPSGVPPMDAYLWSKPSANGVEYFAALPRSGNTTETAKCNNVATVLTDLCVYSSAFHANDFRKNVPPMLNGFVTADLSKTIPSRTQIAAGPGPATATSYRFYIRAGSLGAAGTIEIKQGDRVISIIPITTTVDDYFGTIDLTAGGTVTITSPDRITTVPNVIVYKAGS